MNLLSKFFQHNWLATLYFNFRMLPLRQAIHLPFDFAHGVRFVSLRGKVNLSPDLLLHRAMVRVGGRGSDLFPKAQSVIFLDGEWDILGDGIELGAGCSLHLEKKARLSFGKNVRIGAMCKVYCTRLIEIGEEVDISWEGQVFDTNFHLMEDIAQGCIIYPQGEVHIGSRNWIGNRCNIMKGTVTPDDIIVASNSLLNKDYSSVEKHSMLAGQPAKVVKSNIRRLFEGRDI